MNVMSGYIDVMGCRSDVHHGSRVQGIMPDLVCISFEPLYISAVCVLYCAPTVFSIMCNLSAIVVRTTLRQGVEVPVLMAE